ncbi:MAG: hypothetical protein M1837_005405 [Sclerophora amabilis]|nr:MAG: hypothetical protein M1837_005405 [Sclerophora amabilis]
MKPAEASSPMQSEPLMADSTYDLVQDVPPIAAIFVAHFDVKVGYKLGWTRSNPDVALEGVVEYKSLPSGLHNVEEDLIYFVHDQYAGISAFANSPGTNDERNAKMAAVGVLVPLSFGRLGRSWRHAQDLKDFAREAVRKTNAPNRDDFSTSLQKYWVTHQIREDSDIPSAGSPIESPSSLKIKHKRRAGDDEGTKRPRRHRSVSDGAALAPPGQMLSPFHPALSLPKLFQTFGPLIFPLYRAALLRKRILLVSHAPVEEACNFVYDLSILSNLPHSVEGLLSTSSPSSRLRPLFVVGVHDIELLEDLARTSSPTLETSTSTDSQSEDGRSGWVGCTTDGVLALKRNLFDVVVRLPPPHSEQAKEKPWPTIEDSKGHPMKATQRDLRRYLTLRKGLARQSKLNDQKKSRDWDDRSSGDDEQRTLIPDEDDEDADDDSNVDEQLVEPLSWPTVVVTSLYWWASAGEQRADLVEENEADDGLLDGFDTAHQRAPRSRSRSNSSVSQRFGQPTVRIPEMNSIAYFHRVTAAILTTLADVIEISETDEDRGNDDSDSEDGVVVINSEDLVRMGLDVWSENDRFFVEEMAAEYFGRKARVQGGRVECCGIQVF